MKLLVWNRGEIATRACQAARKLGIETTLFLAPADVAGPAARWADDVLLAETSEAASTFLDLDVLAKAVRDTGATHVYPGYGFLAESESLAAAVEEAGARLVGPPRALLAEMAHKGRAKAFAREAGLPELGIPLATVDGVPTTPPASAFPLLLKAVAGGGGRGNAVVTRPEDFAAAFERLAERSKALFGDAELLAERYLPAARHVELQVFGVDGRVRVLDTRDCSLQRNHQKVVEEGAAAADALGAIEPLLPGIEAALASRGYRNAGTIELLFSRDERRVYFLEMNPRIQVEHPVTELRLGIDLVEWQLREAFGLGTDTLLASPIVPRGHAIQARIYAEDPEAGFAPSPGTVHLLELPSLPFVRWDASVRQGGDVTTHFDPMIAKLLVFGRDRDEAIRRAEHALDHTHVHGVRTNLAMLRWLLSHETFVSDRHDTRTLESILPTWSPDPSPPDVTAFARLVTSRSAPTPSTSRDGSRRWKMAHRS